VVNIESKYKIKDKKIKDEKIRGVRGCVKNNNFQSWRFFIL
jgi:hypothetical protein